MQIGGEGVENMLIKMMLQKKFKNTHMRRHFWYFIWEWAKQVPSYNLVS
jgi:hypothetical protein